MARLPRSDAAARRTRGRPLRRYRAHYAEKIVTLPDSYQANCRTIDIAPVPARAAAGLPEDATVFCSLSQSWKLTPAVFDSWARILRATPGSLLWLLANDETCRRNLRREAAARGLDADRLVFAGSIPPPTISPGSRSPTCSSTPIPTMRTPTPATRCGWAYRC